MAATEAPPVEQLRFDGMPITEHTLVLQGNVQIMDDVAKELRLGEQVTFTITGVISSHKHKATTVQGEASGEVDHWIVLHVLGAHPAADD